MYASVSARWARQLIRRLSSGEIIARRPGEFERKNASATENPVSGP